MGWRSLRLDLRLAHFVLESAVFFGSGAYVSSAGSYCFYSLAVFPTVRVEFVEALRWSWFVPWLRAEAGSRPACE